MAGRLTATQVSDSTFAENPRWQLARPGLVDFELRELVTEATSGLGVENLEDHAGQITSAGKVVRA